MTGPEWKAHAHLPHDVLIFAGTVLARCVRTCADVDMPTAFRVYLTSGGRLCDGLTAAQAKSRALDLIAAAASGVA